MFNELNLNPGNKKVGDCVIRAIDYALQYTWERAYIELAIEGFTEYDMPSSNRVWDHYLRKKGFKRYVAPDTCPDCYTVKDFCRDHPWGVFILATGTHVLVCHNGEYTDSWDSGDEPIIYYYEKGEP
jgi:hypothetical protein